MNPTRATATVFAAATLLFAASCARTDRETGSGYADLGDEPRPLNTLTAEEKAAGWRLLFDGESPGEHWRGYRRDDFPDGWQVRDGAITRVAPAGDIITREQFENFELKLEWRISPGGNSGIFYRVSEDRSHTWETGPEMQVLDNAGHADGGMAVTSAGADYALYAPKRDVTRPVGEFNEVHIIVDGADVTYWMNGVKIVEYELWSDDWEERVANSKFARMPGFGRNKKGHIGLQDHGDEVAYRNIRIRELPSSDG